MKNLTIKQALSGMRNGLTSPTELIQFCQQRVRKTQHLNYMIQETPPEVLFKQSQLFEQQLLQNKNIPSLAGIPFAYKDNFCTKDLPTTCGSKMLLNFNPPYNAAMVEYALQAGAVVIGKTNLDGFAMGAGGFDGHHGPIMNPWNLVSPPDRSKISSDGTEDTTDWYIAGGSSGGSSVAVATGSCFAAFGSDTGGSVRLPASYCGIVGFKPTYGLLSRHGLISLADSMDTIGIYTKTIEDCAIVLNAVCGHDVRDSTNVKDCPRSFKLDESIDLSKLHVGIPREYHAPGLSEDVKSLWVETADKLERAGAKVTQISLPHSRHSRACYHVLCCSEIASNFARYDGIEYGLRCGSEESTEELYAQNRHFGFNDVVRGRILAGNFFLLRRNYEQYFIKAQRIRRLISNDFRDVFSSGVNFILTPTSLSEAPLYSWFSQKDNRTRSAEQDVFTMPANFAGIPAISVPLKLSEAHGLPLSLQLIGPHFSESGLLSLALWFERQAGFQHLDLDFLDNEDVHLFS